MRLKVLVVLFSTIALMGCATPKIIANATGSGIRADVQFCFDDSSIGKSADKYTGGLFSALMGCKRVAEETE